jgi:D-aminopeptidase
VGVVHQAAALAAGAGPDNVILPVVGECDDSDMADSRSVTGEDVERAVDGLAAEVPEGNVGAGTGMTCFGFPGGIGTASRSVGDNYVGVLLLCNFGDRQYLDVLEPLRGAGAEGGSHGSCIAVCATDAPMAPHQLRRLALRPLLGLARAGSYAAEGSGEIGLAFTTSTAEALADEWLNGYFAAAYEAGREAVYNCLIAARPAKRLDGSPQDRFPIDVVRRR